MTPALADVIARTIMRERDTITRALQSAGVAPGDVDDVCQDVVLVALAAAQDGRLAWQHRGSLVRWLHVVASRHALDYQGRAARRELPEAEPEDARLVPSAEDRYLTRETLRVAATSTTPERWRVLRAWANGVPVADIARREGLTAPGVYSRIERARRDIRAAFTRRK
jgi:DNA-directed RNA polymerase specialized sigma24 family protein